MDGADVVEVVAAAVTSGVVTDDVVGVVIVAVASTNGVVADDVVDVAIDVVVVDDVVGEVVIEGAFLKAAEGTLN